MTATISPRAFADLVKSGAKLDLVDVRTPVEFQEVHLALARNVPLDQLDPQKLLAGGVNQPLYVVCRSGSRGRQACELLEKAGHSAVINIEGGTLACLETELPVVRGRKAMSLERQVRIAAGALVLTGIALAGLHPGFLGLSAFVGAGLVFAGVTDTCGMGMILAKMPWNQVRGSSQAACPR